MTVQEAKLDPMWTAQDQAHHVASVKKGLVELLEDDAAFAALDEVAAFHADQSGTNLPVGAAVMSARRGNPRRTDRLVQNLAARRLLRASRPVR